MLTLLYAVFVLSGAAGLIYESIWTRYLGLFVGHSAYAQVIVLVMFLGGMSLGALLVGRRSERLRHPLQWYAGVELATGVIGLVFHDVFVATTAISGPAWRNTVASASRVIADPTVFVTATTGHPDRRARRVGAIVSAVSPDWVTAMTRVRSSRGGGE